MDSCEASRVLFSRIQSLDSENATKIMGYVLLQDHGEKEMIRLAFGPDTLLHSLVVKAKTQLGLCSTSPSTPSTPSSPSPLNPISRPTHLPVSSSSRLASSPSSNPWSLSGLFTPPTSSLSYANIVNVSSFNDANNNNNTTAAAGDNKSNNHLLLPGDSKFDPRLELPISPSPLGDARSQSQNFSLPAVCFQSDEPNSGLGWRPCLYFARGFCKNGSSCRFVHGDPADAAAAVMGPPAKLLEFEQSQDSLLSPAAQQQKLPSVSPFMAAASIPYMCTNFLVQQRNDTQRSALMMGEELCKFGRCRQEKNSFAAVGLGGTVNPSSRQIYLTFPADSTFTEEDVSNYFSIYGPVQDVRIPYQQKRMFGFVTFTYPETVKHILAKGNPHFVCNSRVLVKPYKEKGKVPDKKQHHQQQQQQLERGVYPVCSSRLGLESRDSYALHLGTGMSCNTQDALLRKSLEQQVNLQQAVELQGRRLRNLHLLDLKDHAHRPGHHIMPTGSPLPSPTLSHSPRTQPLFLPPIPIDQAVSKGNSGPVAVMSRTSLYDRQLGQETDATRNHSNGTGTGFRYSKDDNSISEKCDSHGSLEHILPDNLFASPKKSAGDHLTFFSSRSVDVVEKTELSVTSTATSSDPLLPTTTSTLNMASLQSCLLQMPGFSSGPGAIGM